MWEGEDSAWCDVLPAPTSGFTRRPMNDSPAAYLERTPAWEGSVDSRVHTSLTCYEGYRVQE